MATICEGRSLGVVIEVGKEWVLGWVLMLMCVLALWALAQSLLSRTSVHPRRVAERCAVEDQNCVTEIKWVDVYEPL